MGKGTDAARLAGAGIHADVLDDFKDQLLLSLVRQHQTASGQEFHEVPVDLVDDNGGWTMSFQIIDRKFRFYAKRKS